MKAITYFIAAEEKPEVQAVEVVIEDRVAKEEVKEDEEEDVKDAWDADSSQDEEEGITLYFIYCNMRKVPKVFI